MPNSFKVGQAPWEVNRGSVRTSFPVGQAPWEVVQKPKPNVLPEATGIGSVVTDALKTLIVKPAVRFGQLVGTPIARALGASEEGLQRATETPVSLPIGKTGLGITVEPQKRIGEGGATQIFSDAFKSATYLAPYGKIAGGVSGVITGMGAKSTAQLAREVAAQAVGKTAPVVASGIGKIVGGIAAGFTGGYGVDVAQGLEEGERAKAFIPGFATIIGGLTGGLLEGGAVGLEKITQNAGQLAKQFEQDSFKLTPIQKTKLASKLDDITNFSIKEIPSGNPKQRFAYADDLYEHYEENFQRAITNKPMFIDKNEAIKQMEAIKSEYQFDRDAEAIFKQIDGAIRTIKNQYQTDKIPVDKFNIFKRTTYQNAYNKAGDKVLDTVEHDIGDVARSLIERATKGVQIMGRSVADFNKDYGNLIQLRKILRVAEGREGIGGITKRISARIIGGLIGHALGGIPGMIGGEMLAEPLAGKVAGTSAKTNIARKLTGIAPITTGSVIQKLRP